MGSTSRPSRDRDHPQAALLRIVHPLEHAGDELPVFGQGVVDVTAIPAGLKER